MDDAARADALAKLRHFDRVVDYYDRHTPATRADLEEFRQEVSALRFDIGRLLLLLQTQLLNAA